MNSSSGAFTRRSIAVLALILAAIALLPAAAPAPATAQDLPIQRVVPNASAGPGEDTLIYLANTNSTNPWTFVLRLHRPDGSLIGERTLIVPPRETGLFRVSSFLGAQTGPSVSGVLHIGGPQGVVTTSVIHQKALGTSGVNPPKYLPTITSAEYTLPYVANRLNQTYDTEIWVANADDAPVCVSIEFAFVAGQGSVGPAGKPKVKGQGPGNGGCQAGEYLVPVNGQIGFSPFIAAPNIAAGLYPFPEATRDALLSARIVARTGGLAIIVEGTVSGYSKRAAYEAFFVSTTGLFVSPQLSSYFTIHKTMIVPFAIKSPDGYYTQILISNPNASAASVAIDYDDGNGKTYRKTLTIPANGVDNHSVWADDVVPVGFVGTARVNVLNNLPVAAVVFRTKMTDGGTFIEENIYTAVNAAPRMVQGTVTTVPYAARRVPDRDPGSLNTWITITPVFENEPAYRVEATARGRTCAADGSRPYSSSVEYEGVQTAIFYQNAATMNGFGVDLPPCFEGSIQLATPGVSTVVAASWLIGNAPGENEAVFLLTDWR